MTAQQEAALKAAALAARTILESSGETYRAEDTALRMCTAFGLEDAQIIAFPTGFVLSAGMGGNQESKVFRVQDRYIRLDRIDLVNTVSREAAEGRLSPEAALDKLNSIRTGKSAPFWQMNLAYAFSAAFFSVMFGGRGAEFVLSAFIGSFVHFLQHWLVRLHIPGQLRSFVLGLLAAFIALAALALFNGAQEPVITGVIMPLLPGLAMTNAIRDTMRGDLISGLARSAEALTSAVLLSAGVAAALYIRGTLWIV
jgi:uncharacterized membrane protein YjjP (DUF1212 family)